MIYSGVFFLGIGKTNIKGGDGSFWNSESGPGSGFAWLFISIGTRRSGPGSSTRSVPFYPTSIMIVLVVVYASINYRANESFRVAAGRRPKEETANYLWPVGGQFAGYSGLGPGLVCGSTNGWLGTDKRGLHCVFDSFL